MGSFQRFCQEFTKRIRERNASPNTVFQKMEEFRRLTRWNGLSRIEKQHLAEFSILLLVIIFDRVRILLRRKPSLCIKNFCLFSTMQSTVFLLKITENSKLVVNRLLFKLLIFLIIDFKILGHVEKHFFSREHHFQKHHFLILSRMPKISLPL